MTCNLSQLLLAVPPGELAPDDRAALDAHTRSCPTCASLAATDAAIRKAMIAVPVPSGLRDRLYAQADSARAAAWKRRAGWVAAGLAACLALGTGFGAWSYFARPELDADRTTQWLENERMARQQAVGEWLTAQGLPPDLPEPFEFGYHDFHGTGPLGSAELPCVVFRHDRGQCRVYVLHSGAVRLPTGRWGDVTGSEFTHRTIERNGVTYLIAVSTGTTLETFLRRTPAAI
ncbi:MAG: hypothetical protein MUF18_00690 [Fimbriiglobus sp.]|jgi:hypothetical protein|nr:hypothetical protein [Fimbriiglobus sp.]